MFIFSYVQYNFQDLEHCHPEVPLLKSSCKSLYRLSARPNAKERMDPAFTTPWSALVLIRAAKTLVRETQEVPWSVRTMTGSSWRVLCLGEADALLQANMAYTPGSVS